MSGGAGTRVALGGHRRGSTGGTGQQGLGRSEAQTAVQRIRHTRSEDTRIGVRNEIGSNEAVKRRQPCETIRARARHLPCSLLGVVRGASETRFSTLRKQVEPSDALVSGAPAALRVSLTSNHTRGRLSNNPADYLSFPPSLQTLLSLRHNYLFLSISPSPLLPPLPRDGVVIRPLLHQLTSSRDLCSGSS